jgi:hypothetical protein
VWLLGLSMALGQWCCQHRRWCGCGCGCWLGRWWPLPEPCPGLGPSRDPVRSAHAPAATGQQRGRDHTGAGYVLPPSVVAAVPGGGLAPNNTLCCCCSCRRDEWIFLNSFEMLPGVRVFPLSAVPLCMVEGRSLFAASPLTYRPVPRPPSCLPANTSVLRAAPPPPSPMLFESPHPVVCPV